MRRQFITILTILTVLALALALQYIGTGLAALGFAILKPVSVMEQYVRDNPDSTIAMVRLFSRETGFTGLIGLQQAWVMWMSAVPLLLVALLDLWPAARRRMLIAAPVYSVSLVITCYLWFQRAPVMSGYAITWVHAAEAAVLAAAGGLLLGWVGLRVVRVSRLAAPKP